MKHVALALAACVTLAAFSGSAHADEVVEATATAPSAKEAPPKTESRWYGYQTLSADGAALAFGAISASSDSHPVQTGFGVASLLAYAVAPAVIHGVHGHPGKAVGDVAIRLGAPVICSLIGVVIGAATYTVHRSPGGLDDGLGSLGAALAGGAIGLTVGVVTAVVLDAAVLSRETIEVAPPAPKPQAMTVLPSAAPTKNGFTAGLVGTF